MEEMERRVRPATPTSSKRRTEILSGAARVLAAKGIFGATVRDIADESGILSGSLYHHFPSKDHMVLEILHPLASRQHNRFRAVVDEEDANGSDVEAILRRLIEMAVHDVADNPDASVILRNDLHLFDQIPLLAPLEQLRRESAALWEDLLARGVEEGVLRLPMAPSALVLLLHDLLLNTVRRFVAPEPADPAEVGRQISDFLLDGIRHRQPS
jgi:AcrR family transcriptional regulator